MTVKLLETSAKAADDTTNYDGALLNSGLVLGAPLGYEFRVDLRVVYQYYCKNLPRPDQPQYQLWLGVPSESKMTLKDLKSIVTECTGVTMAPEARTDLQRQNLANIVGVMGFSERLLYRHMQSSTLLFRDIVQATTNGRNPFSNVGVHYRGSSDDLPPGCARLVAKPLPIGSATNTIGIVRVSCARALTAAVV